VSGAAPNSDDLVKARSLCETLMRLALSIDKHNRDFVKSLRQYSLDIERQTTAMSNVLRREVKEYPET
jgi:hypothetical protein